MPFVKFYFIFKCKICNKLTTKFPVYVVLNHFSILNKIFHGIYQFFPQMS